MPHALIRAAHGTGRDLALKAKAPKCAVRTASEKAMLVSVLHRLPLLCNHLTSKIAGRQPALCLEGAAKKGSIWLKLGSTESHFDRHPERRSSRSDPTPHQNTRPRNSS
jgi:hypothetical protein